MQDNLNPNLESGSGAITSRRGFVTAVSLGAVSLYGLWAAYGAAPFRLFGGGHGAEREPMPEAGGHGGHGVDLGPSADEFRRLTEEFVARFRQADGSVRVDAAPTHAATVSPTAAEHRTHGAGHDKTSMSGPAAAPPAPTDIYLLAQQWSFEPDVLRLRANVPYRFRMMAVDVGHGASLQLGKGSRIIRLRRGTIVEQELTFTQPGERLVYCTIYCGIGHDRMSGRIIVT